MVAACPKDFDSVILETIRNGCPVGREITFQLNYSSLVRAMTSPFVEKVYHAQSQTPSRYPQFTRSIETQD